ncbi:MAG TPA: DUF2256 domain-containing protein, partial [Candidatus Nanopelagicales bacterium]|nr:DUF2256 domain-containing protein [Candidatus Nanopelagicales bacterium]
MPGKTGDAKTCSSCGRQMAWRKSWERNWDEVKYCSEACRKRKISPVDVELEHRILAILDSRKSGA